MKNAAKEAQQLMLIGDFNVDQYDEEAELVPTDIDETTNDVDQSENEIEREAKAEFDGTDATASVEDIF